MFRIAKVHVHQPNEDISVIENQCDTKITILSDNLTTMLCCTIIRSSVPKSPTIDNFVRSRVVRCDNQSVGVRHFMTCKILADKPDQLFFAVIYIITFCGVVD